MTIIDTQFIHGLHIGFDTYLSDDGYVVYVDNVRAALAAARTDEDGNVLVPTRRHKDYETLATGSNDIAYLPNEGLIPLTYDDGTRTTDLIVGKAGETTVAGYASDDVVAGTTSRMRSMNLSEVPFLADLFTARSILSSETVASLQQDNLDKQAAIERLSADLRDARSDAAAARTNHEQDIDIIGNAFIEEADRRGWCSDADDFIDTLNRGLHLSLPERSSDYYLAVRVSGTTVVALSYGGLSTDVSVHWSVTVSVAALGVRGNPNDIDWEQIITYEGLATQVGQIGAEPTLVVGDGVKVDDEDEAWLHIRDAMDATDITEWEVMAVLERD